MPEMMKKLSEQSHTDNKEVPNYKKFSTLNAYDDPLERFYAENKNLYRELSKHFIKPFYYTLQMRDKITMNEKKITFFYNREEPIHRWSPYLEGFSSEFVRSVIRDFGIKHDKVLLDPFAGCGTLNVTAKMNNIDSIGVEINPTMHFILRTKLDWDIDKHKFEQLLKRLDFNQKINIEPPSFLDCERQFKPDVLKKLLQIKQAIINVENTKFRNLLMLALGSILMKCSNLKRSPSIGYDSTKHVTAEMTQKLLNKKVLQMIEDLGYVRTLDMKAKVKAINGDSRNVVLAKDSVDFIITSPPYLNFQDYTQNYKIEMGWLGFMNSKKDYRVLKDSMVVCDNVSRKLIRDFSKLPRLFVNEWLDQIQEILEKKMQEKPPVRRQDYHFIVRKYFDDLYQIMKNISKSLVVNGKFIIVIGDSLISGVYVPTDLLLAKIGEETGFSIQKIVVVRSRRSGIIRSFRLRESIVYLNKES